MFKNIFKITFIIIALLQFSCQLPEVSDIEPPVVALVFPANGTVLTESVVVTVSATDDKEVASVYYYFDGELMESAAASTASFEMDLTPFQDNQTHFFQGGANDKAGNKGLSAQVTVLISDRLDITPPDVEIISPTDGKQVVDTVKIVANAFDASGIREVAFFVEGDSIITDRSYPFEYYMTVTDFAEIGDLRVQAKAFDNANNWSLSTPVTVSILNTNLLDQTPPTVSILYPLTGQVVGETVRVSVNAFDGESGIDKVEYLVNGETAFTNNVAPYAFVWSLIDVPQAAERTVQARAFDKAGNFTISDQVTVTKEVQETDTEAPVITILYPLANTTISGTVRIALDVIDNVGVEKVEFYIDGGVNGNPNSSLTNPPWNYDWNTTGLPSTSVHSLYIKAYDAAGNVGVSGPVGYTIQ